MSDAEAGERLDRWLAGRGLGLSRAQAQRLIDLGLVAVNGIPARKRTILKQGDRIQLEALAPPKESRPGAPVGLDIVHEDEDILVVNKPPMVVVHPVRSGESGTLVDALRRHTRRLSTLGGEDRPGIVHRLDKGTSGLLVVAKTDEAHRGLTAQFKARTVDKRYRAVVWGRMPSGKGNISAPVGRHRWQRKRMSVRCEGGREADTAYEVGRRFALASVVLLKPGSGRTHQLRVHLAYVGHPIFGDPQYGGRRIPGNVSAKDRKRIGDLLKRCPRQALHAEMLSFIHPSGERPCRFQVPLPEDIQAVMDGLWDPGGEQAE